MSKDYEALDKFVGFDPDEIVSAIERIQDEEYSLEKRHKQEWRELSIKRHQIRSRCIHPKENIGRHYDASGNNDSYYFCRLCGEELD